MKKSTFKGGVHPPEFKSLSMHKYIKVASLPQRVIIPLQQHTGSQCKSLVNVGDNVKRGQKIASSETFISASVHASISGKVTRIEPYIHPVGTEVLSIFIESDGKDILCEPITPHGDYFRLLPKEIVQIVYEAGIVGLGGAAFPTHVKLKPPKDKAIKTVILNACECEPYLTCDERIMTESPRQVIDGLKIIMRAMDVNRGVIAIEANKPGAINILNKEIYHEPDIRLEVLKTKYPQGSEKQVIKAVLNKEVSSGALPMDVGCVVDNVGTAYAIWEAVTKGTALTERVITVSGSSIREPQNIKVRIGTLFSDIIEQCGGYQGTPGKIIMGGPMMGLAQYTADVPIVKGTSGILVLSQDEAGLLEERACIRCGKCVNACPMGLLPNMLSILAENDEWEKTSQYDINDCIECGGCSYICPAKRRIVQYIKRSKAELRKKS